MLAHLLTVEVGVTAELVDGARALLARGRDLREAREVGVVRRLPRQPCARGISGLVQCRRWKRR